MSMFPSPTIKDTKLIPTMPDEKQLQDGPHTFVPWMNDMLIWGKGMWCLVAASALSFYSGRSEDRWNIMCIYKFKYIICIKIYLENKSICMNIQQYIYINMF